MTHKFYPECSLVVVKDDSGERLFKIEQQKGKRKLLAAEFIHGAQKFIEICGDYNLIIAPNGLFTLEGEVVEHTGYAHIQTVQYESTLLLIFKHYTDEERIDKICLWDKKRIIWQATPQKLIYTDKYISVYNNGWEVFDACGNKMTINGKLSSSVRIAGDLLISDMVGCHDVYSLKTGNIVMQNQQLVKVSSRKSFVIGLNLQQTATLWYNGNVFQIENVSFIDIIDEVDLFYLKSHNYSWFNVFGYCASWSALNDNLLFTCVKMISFDEQNRQLMVTMGNKVFFYRTDEIERLKQLPSKKLPE